MQTNQKPREESDKGIKKTTLRVSIISQHGETLSTHRSWEAAEQQQQRNLAWRCGICGNNKRGFGRCSHGQHAQVCSAKHYNNKLGSNESAETIY